MIPGFIKSTSTDLAGDIRRCLLCHDVVVVRDVFGIGGGLLSPYEFANLMHEIGRVWTTRDELKAETKFQLPGHPEIIELAHDGLLGSRELPMHSDASHHPARPYPSRALYPVVLPDDDSAQTSWYSMYDTAGAMSSLLLNKFRNVICYHQPAYGTGWPGRWAKLIEIDPWTGREYLAYDEIFIKKYMRNEYDSWDRLVQKAMTEEEVAYLKNTIRYCLAEPYTHTWALGDLVVWNNRGTVHMRTPVTPGKHRKMWRITFDRINP